MKKQFIIKRFILILLTAGLLLPGLSPSTHAAVEVRVGVYQNKPKVFIDENGKADGFYIDLLEHIAKSEDWNLQYIPGTWSQCLDRLEKGQIDLLPDIAFSEDRTLRFDFNHKTVLSNWAVVYTLKGSEIESFRDLKGKKIAFMKEDITIEQFASEIKPYGIEFAAVEANDYPGVLKLIVQGKADAGLVNHLFGVRNEKQYNITRSPIICCPRELRFAAPKNKNSHLLKIIDQYLTQFKNDEQSVYYQAITHWIEGKPPWKFPGWILRVLFITSGLVLLFMVIAVIFRFQVKTKTTEVLAVNQKLQKEMVEHKKTAAVLQKNEERLRLSTELANVAVWEYDFTTNSMSRSKNHDQLYGLEWQTKWDITTFLNTTHPEDREVSNAIIQKSTAAKGPDQYTFDFRVIYPDQSIHWLMVTGQVVERDLEGQGTMVRGCLIDITERKQAMEEISILNEEQMALALENAQLYEKTLEYASSLEDRIKERTKALEENQKALMNVVEDLNEKTETLKAANVKLKELDQLKNIFLASMSHELRTPLNSIIGFTGILLMGLTGELTNEQKKQLGMVKNSAHHLLGLINDILDISKVEAGMMVPVPEKFSLDDLIKETMASVLVTAQDKCLELTYKGLPDLILFSDQKRIRQIILNLLSNAIKFTEQGSIHLNVQSSNSSPNPLIQICVTDTGIGIKKEDINRLFFPFQQVDAALTKKFEGTGLGLYLSKKLANLLGGDITVKSEYGNGSEFMVELPLMINKKENT